MIHQYVTLIMIRNMTNFISEAILWSQNWRHSDTCIVWCASALSLHRTYLFRLIVEQADQLLDRFQVFESRHVFRCDGILPDGTWKERNEAIKRDFLYEFVMSKPVAAARSSRFSRFFSRSDTRGSRPPNCRTKSRVFASSAHWTRRTSKNTHDY